MPNDTTDQDAEERGGDGEARTAQRTNDGAEGPTVEPADPAARLQQLARRVEALTERLEAVETTRGRGRVSRRSLLGLLGVGSLAGLGAGTAGADPQGQVGTQSDPLADLYTLNVRSPADQLRVHTGGSVAGRLTFDGQNPDLLIGTGHSAPSPSGGRTISGGRNHQASADYTTVGGGTGNTASSASATVAGGGSNTADGAGAAISGGTNNQASGTRSTVAGGEGNRATGEYSIVPGGQNCQATAPHSFAGGTNASADHEGAFAWSDTSSGGISTLNPDEFVASAAGGVYFYTNESATTGVELPSGSGSWSSASSRALKSDVEPVSAEAVLDRVTDLEITRWSYDSEDGVRHMGPMAEAFHETFGLGADAESISTVDADGVALGAIQGLAERGADRDDAIEANDDRLTEQEAALRDHDDRLAAQRRRVESLERENEALRDRLQALEARVDGETASSD